MRFQPAESKRKTWTAVLTLVVGLAALVVVWVSAKAIWGKATLSYRLTPTTVEIVYGPRRVVLRREDITRLEMVPRLTGARRRVGTAMPGLYEGRWSFNETGPLILYATARDSLVLIETPDGRWGISPADPEGFVAAYQANIPGHYPPVESDAAWPPILLGGVALLTLGTFAAVMYPLWRMSTGMEYELGETALLIHGSLGPIVLPYSEIVQVRLENPAGSPLRLWGAAFPGLYWGSFTWKQAGGRLKLYATRLRPLVLVSLRRQTYGLSPANPQAFLAELQRRVREHRG